MPLHFPEHEAIKVFGNREEYEAALRGDPIPRFRGVLVQGRRARAPSTPMRSTSRPAHEMEAAVEFGIESPLPDPAEATNYVYA